jgi:hypothetical protein
VAMSKRYVHLLTPNAMPFLLLTLSSIKTINICLEWLVQRSKPLTSSTTRRVRTYIHSPLHP